MKEDMFQELVASVREGGAILREEVAPSRVFVVESPDVKAIRKRMNLTQQAFAHLLGISVRTLQNWEQGRRTPRGPARVLLQVADKHPEAILDVIAQGRLSQETAYYITPQAAALHDRNSEPSD